jgi:hypothetical protein
VRKLEKIVRLYCIVTVILLFAAALWLRTTSLEDIAEPNGDEAYFGIQAARLLNGETFAAQTGSNNILDPFTTGMQLPFLLFFGPSFWVLRVPSVISGILAVILAYTLGSRILDRATALIAAVLLATLPITIIFSRVGCEYSHAPLVGLIAIFFAFRGSKIGTLLSYLVCFIVHPLNAFIMPILLAVYLTQALRAVAEDSAKRRRVLIETTLASAAIVAAIGFYMSQRRSTSFYYNDTGYYRPQEWGRFLTWFGRFFFWLYTPVSEADLRLHDRLFWSLFLGALFLGTRRLMLNRQWDRVALIVGLLLSITGLHWVAGSNVLAVETHRYGAFLVAPTVLAFACTVQSLLTAPTDERRSMARRLQLAAILTMVWVLPFDIKLHYFDRYTNTSHESLWTFRNDSRDPKERALRLILADIDRANPGREAGPGGVGGSDAGRCAPKHIIITEDWWLYRPLQYLAIPRKDVRLVWFEKMGTDPEQHRRLLLERLEGGAYAVAYPGKVIEDAVRTSFPPERLQSLDIRERHGERFVTIYRLAGPAPRVASRPSEANR